MMPTFRAKISRKTTLLRVVFTPQQKLNDDREMMNRAIAAFSRCKKWEVLITALAA